MGADANLGVRRGAETWAYVYTVGSGSSASIFVSSRSHHAKAAWSSARGCGAALY